jgi:hypothetical protein
VAGAWHPDITATARCDEGTDTFIIDFTSTAWQGFGSDPTNDSSRENSQIDIAFDGVVVHSGAFVAPHYSFSGSAPAPAGKVAGDSVVVTATAVGLWGGAFADTSSRSVTVTLPEDDCGGFIPALGRFTGGGNQVRVEEARVTGGLSDNGKVTRGLTIHCDRLLSNNLQVNWNGNSFHMTEHLVTVACTDDPAINQAPPPAPIDTLVGVGAGRYNGVDGYTIEFTLVDQGEPGGKSGSPPDQMAIRIFQTSNPGNVVLSLPLQALDGGNLQAHYDQPHK